MDLKTADGALIRPGMKVWLTAPGAERAFVEVARTTDPSIDSLDKLIDSGVGRGPADRATLAAFFARQIDLAQKSPITVQGVEGGLVRIAAKVEFHGAPLSAVIGLPPYLFVSRSPSEIAKLRALLHEASTPGPSSTPWYGTVPGWGWAAIAGVGVAGVLIAIRMRRG